MVNSLKMTITSACAIYLVLGVITFLVSMLLVGSKARIFNLPLARRVGVGLYVVLLWPVVWSKFFWMVVKQK